MLHGTKNTFPVFLPPPGDFVRGQAKSGQASPVAGFSKDVARDKELFGLTGSASPSPRKYLDSRKYFPKKYDKLITRTERNDRYKHVKPLNSMNKPKYSAIERSSDYQTERRSDKMTTNLIDASRFDYDVDNYDYIEEETENYSNDFSDYQESFEDRIEDRVDDLKLKRKYLDERLSSYLGLDQADRRNIRIHNPSKSSARISTKRPKKKIIIRRFKKTYPRTSKKGSKRSKRKNSTTKLTPAEEHYLKTRQTKLTARSINDNLEGESHHPHYHQSLHGHDLQGAIVREATGYRAEKFAEPKKIQFQIHGQGGPNSYRFGHDTGIG